MNAVKQVLVIDDDENARRMICAMLSREGFSVRMADNGRKGLAMHRDGWADVIVTDLMMPEQDGLEVIREIRRNKLATRIVAMSGNGLETFGNMLLEAAQLMGADVILAKPFTYQELMDAVKGTVH